MKNRHGDGAIENKVFHQKVLKNQVHETMTNNLKYLLGPMRIPFLVITPASVLLGLGTAVWTAGHVSIYYFILALLGAVSAHISVNAFNEYFDFKSGLDLKTSRTPFSGGSGTLPERPAMACCVLYTAVITFAVTVFMGLFFIYVRGLWLLPVGVLGLLTIFAYTPWLSGSPLLCLVAPGVGFGPLMVMGTHFVLTGEYSLPAFIASLVPFFLISDLLLLNQFPDIEADRNVGRRNFPIVVGRRNSGFIYGVFLLMAYLSIIFGACFGFLPEITLIGLLTVIMAVPAFVGGIRYRENIEKLIPYMGLNVIICVVTPVLVAAGLLVA